VIVVIVLGAAYLEVMVQPGHGVSSSGTSTAATTPPPTKAFTTSAEDTTATSVISTNETSSLSGSGHLFSSFSSSSSSSSSSSPISHVIIILMENEEYGSVIGNASAPFENRLASSYAVAGDYFGVSHPSLPNYLALVAGSTFDVTSDCPPSQCSIPSNVSTIASLIDARGLSWKEYAESMPTDCSQTNSADGLYVTKHDPFVYFDSITGDNGTGVPSSYCGSHVVSLDQFWTDLQAGALPNYSFITPNICDDAHSCPLSTGDAWLSTTIPRITNSSEFSSTAVFITYDEGSTNASATGAPGGGKVLCIAVSPYAKHGYMSDVPYSHYSLLATVEAIFGLGSLGRNDLQASPMSDLFTTGIP
jgi:hypothetical protein